MTKYSVRVSILLLACNLIVSVAVGADTPPQFDGDHDGVSDELDRCPGTPQITKISKSSRIAVLFEPEYLTDKPVSVAVNQWGCARDSDFDQVPDYLDFCPEDLPLEISAGVASNGCPLQTDADGTPDYRDKCPATPKGVNTDQFGCPRENAV